MRGKIYARYLLHLEKKPRKELFMDSPFIGQIQSFGFNFAPRDWVFCRGQLMSISSNQALFALIGTAFGGDGRSTMGLPNLNGRTAVGTGQAAGSPFHWTHGEMGGGDSRALTVSEMPAHSHPSQFELTSSGLQASVHDGDSETPSAGAFLAKATPPRAAGADKPEKIYSSNLGDNPVLLGGLTVNGEVTVGVAGQGAPFTVVQASLAVNYSIALQGVFPSRS